MKCFRSTIDWNRAIMRKYKPVLDYNKFNAMLIVKAKNYWIAKHQK